VTKEEVMLSKEEVMRKALLPLFLFASLASPTAVLANGDGGEGGHHRTSARSGAAQQCKAERAQLGHVAFQQKYGAPHAFKNCVRAKGGSTKPNDPNGDQNGERKHKKDKQQGEHKDHVKHHNGDQNQGNGDN
jgi:hypothetical protein